MGHSYHRLIYLKSKFLIEFISPLFSDLRSNTHIEDFSHSAESQKDMCVLVMARARTFRAQTITSMCVFVFISKKEFFLKNVCDN